MKQDVMSCSAKAPMCPCYKALAEKKGAETFEDSWEDSWEKGVIRLAISGGCFTDEYAEWVERQIDGPSSTLNNPRYKKIIDKRWGLSAENESFSADNMNGLLTLLTNARTKAYDYERGYDYSWESLNRGDRQDIDLSMEQLEKRSNLMVNSRIQLQKLITDIVSVDSEDDAETFEMQPMDKKTMAQFRKRAKQMREMPQAEKDKMRKLAMKDREDSLKRKNAETFEAGCVGCQMQKPVSKKERAAIQEQIDKFNEQLSLDPEDDFERYVLLDLDDDNLIEDAFFSRQTWKPLTEAFRKRWGKRSELMDKISQAQVQEDSNWSIYSFEKPFWFDYECDPQDTGTTEDPEGYGLGFEFDMTKEEAIEKARQIHKETKGAITMYNNARKRSGGGSTRIHPKFWATPEMMEEQKEYYKREDMEWPTGDWIQPEEKKAESYSAETECDDGCAWELGYVGKGASFGGNNEMNWDIHIYCPVCRTTLDFKAIPQDITGSPVANYFKGNKESSFIKERRRIYGEVCLECGDQIDNPLDIKKGLCYFHQPENKEEILNWDKEHGFSAEEDVVCDPCRGVDDTGADYVCADCENDICYNHMKLWPQPNKYDFGEHKPLHLCLECYQDNWNLFLKTGKQPLDLLNAESHAYSYAYNDGHSDSRKREEYRPNLSGSRQEADFKKILKQKAEYSRDSDGRFSSKSAISLTTAAIIGLAGAYLWRGKK